MDSTDELGITSDCLKGVLSFGIPVAGSNLGTQSSWCLSLELNFKNLANSAARSQITIRFLKLTASNHAPGACSSLFSSAVVANGIGTHKNQRYFQSGMDYFQKERYPEAIIQFKNAVPDG